MKQNVSKILNQKENIKEQNKQTNKQTKKKHICVKSWT